VRVVHTRTVSDGSGPSGFVPDAVMIEWKPGPATDPWAQPAGGSAGGRDARLPAMQTGDVLRPGAADASVRRATPADVPAIAAVQTRALRAAYADILDPEVLAELSAGALEPSWTSEVGRRQSPSARHTVLVACSGSTVVAVAAIRPSEEPDADGDDGDLAVLAVDPAHQRAGHGSRLLSAVVAHLRETGVTRLVAWSPATDEARRGFLTSAGMVPDGARRTYETSDGRRVTEVRLSAALAE